MTPQIAVFLVLAELSEGANQRVPRYECHGQLVTMT